jgi:hypothetical protein
VNRKNIFPFDFVSTQLPTLIPSFSQLMLGEGGRRPDEGGKKRLLFWQFFVSSIGLSRYLTFFYFSNFFTAGNHPTCGWNA